jgi:hypothetical protein
MMVVIDPFAEFNQLLTDRLRCDVRRLVLLWGSLPQRLINRAAANK